MWAVEGIRTGGGCPRDNAPYSTPASGGTELRVGDESDPWRVVSVEPGRRLTRRAEMRLPGRQHASSSCERSLERMPEPVKVVQGSS